MRARSWLTVLLSAVLSTAFVLGGAAGPAVAVGTVTAVVYVPGWQPWTDTGIDVGLGSTVSINATGIVHVAGSDVYGKTPAGAPGCVATGDNSIPPGPFIAPGLTCWSLIGRLGPAGQPFEVGVAVQFIASTAGRLYLGVDDNYFPDNFGYWVATITVAPGVLLAPVASGVNVTVVHGYNSPAYSTGPTETICKIGSPLDHCANQQFGLDLQPGPGWDHLILAPAPGTTAAYGPVAGYGGSCLNFRLDDGTNLNICHFLSVSVGPGIHVERGKVLGVSNQSWIHLSLDARSSGTSCSGGWILPGNRTGTYYCPVPMIGSHAFEYADLPWDDRGHANLPVGGHGLPR